LLRSALASPACRTALRVAGAGWSAFIRGNSSSSVGHSPQGKRGWAALTTFLLPGYRRVKAA
jgi:hypothetical protein